MQFKAWSYVICMEAMWLNDEILWHSQLIINHNQSYISKYHLSGFSERKYFHYLSYLLMNGHYANISII